MFHRQHRDKRQHDAGKNHRHRCNADDIRIINRQIQREKHRPEIMIVGRQRVREPLRHRQPSGGDDGDLLRLQRQPAGAASQDEERNFFCYQPGQVFNF